MEDLPGPSVETEEAIAVNQYRKGDDLAFKQRFYDSETIKFESKKRTKESDHSQDQWTKSLASPSEKSQSTLNSNREQNEIVYGEKRH